MKNIYKKLGVTTLISEISYVVDHGKLPNWVTVVVVGFALTFGKK